MNGVVTVAFGPNARTEAEAMIASLRQYHDWPVVILADGPVINADIIRRFDDAGWGARWAKLNQDQIVPWDRWLYLDADTRIHGDLSAGFDILSDGWDLCITASEHQTEKWLWQASDEERRATGSPLDLSLQGGVFYARKCERVHQFFDVWRTQWQRWQHIDQAALIRAVRVCPIRLWLLGRAYNGRDGATVEHLFGRAVTR